MTRQIIKQFSFAVVPILLFYLLYRLVGILPAIVVSGALSLGIVLYHLVRKQKVTLPQIIGLVCVALSFVSVYFSDNDNLYFLPMLLNNVVLAVIAIVLTARRQSVVHFVMRDFGIDWLDDTDPADYMRLNYIWIALQSAKVLMKVLGMLFMDFDALYWLVFLFGDPSTIAYILYCSWYVRKRRRQGQDKEETTV